MTSLAMSSRAPAMSESERSLLGACSGAVLKAQATPLQGLGLSRLGPRLRAVRSPAAVPGPPE